jgi:ADP-ribosylglycohydrolase
MYFAAAISAAFELDDPLKALHMGLQEIPRNCTTAKAVRWALNKSRHIANYTQAREAVDRKFKGMHRTHTINNACLTIFGITIGGTDLTKVISQTVAMGLDNDCTAATAGSIVGAVAGKKNIPTHWHKGFNNTVHSYLNRRPRFSITGLLARFEKQARRTFSAG